MKKLRKGLLNILKDVGPITSIDFSWSESWLGYPVAFTASVTSSEAIQSYAWDFGDGQTGTGIIRQHQYASVGTYSVTLTVTTVGGHVASVTKEYEYIELLPVIGCHLNNVPVTCVYQVGDVIRLYCEAVDGLSNQNYYWSGPNGWTARGRNTTRANCTLAMAGTYSCYYKKNNMNSSTATTEVIINE